MYTNVKLVSSMIVLASLGLAGRSWCAGTPLKASLGVEGKEFQETILIERKKDEAKRQWNPLVPPKQVNPTPAGLNTAPGTTSNPVNRIPGASGVATPSPGGTGSPIANVITPPGGGGGTDPGTGPVNLNGVGNLNRTATADGPLNIRPYLYSRVGGNIQIRLFDAAGTEIRFGGRSLFEWSRPDGRQNSPAFFKGQRRGESMFLENPPDDFTASQGLSYTHNITAGQRIEVRVSGDAPADKSFLKMSGPF